MNYETIQLGHAYECQPVGLKKRITGEVIKKLDRCVVVNVERYDYIDHDEIQERCGKVVVRYEEIYGKALVSCFFS